MTASGAGEAGDRSSSEGQPREDRPVCLCVCVLGGMGSSRPSTTCSLPDPQDRT